MINNFKKYYSIFILSIIIISLIISNYLLHKKVKILEETNLEYKTKISDLYHEQACIKDTVEGMQEMFNKNVDFLCNTDYDVNNLKLDIHYIQEELQNIGDTLDNR